MTAQLELPGFAPTRPPLRVTFSPVARLQGEPPCGFIAAYERDDTRIGGWVEADEGGTWCGFWYRERAGQPPEHVPLAERYPSSESAGAAIVQLARRYTQ